MVKILSAMFTTVIIVTALPVMLSMDTKVVVRFSLDFSSEPFIVPALRASDKSIVNLTIGGDDDTFTSFNITGLVSGTSVRWRITAADLRIDDISGVPPSDILDAVAFGIDNDWSGRYSEMSLSLGAFGEFRDAALFDSGPERFVNAKEFSYEVPKGLHLSYLHIEVTNPSDYRDDLVFNADFYTILLGGCNDEVGPLTKTVSINRLEFDPTAYVEWYNWWLNPLDSTIPTKTPYVVSVTINDNFVLTDYFGVVDERGNL